MPRKPSRRGPSRRERIEACRTSLKRELDRFTPSYKQKAEGVFGQNPIRIAGHLSRMMVTCLNHLDLKPAERREVKRLYTAFMWLDNVDHIILASALFGKSTNIKLMWEHVGKACRAAIETMPPGRRTKIDLSKIPKYRESLRKRYEAIIREAGQERLMKELWQMANKLAGEHSPGR